MQLAEEARPQSAAKNSPRGNEQATTIRPLARDRARRHQQKRADDEVIDITWQIGKIRPPPANFQKWQSHAEAVSSYDFKAVSGWLHLVDAYEEQAKGRAASTTTSVRR